MVDFTQLIEFETEHTSLDFKAKQYAKNDHLLKDVLAMANAKVSGDRHIIVGVKQYPDGNRDYLGIDEKEFVDAATYQQLIRENIEPEVDVEYLPVHFQGKLFGVLRICHCTDQPYMMRKDFLPLKKGDAFIRKGTQQGPLTRADLDLIWENRQNRFTEKIRIGFDASRWPKELVLPAWKRVPLPSDLAAEKIQTILAERTKQVSGDLRLPRAAIEASLLGSIFGGTPYEHRSTNTLQEDLKCVKDTYRDDDLYELYEVHAQNVNLFIENQGESYLDDASIRIRIPKIGNFRVAPRIYNKPDRTGPFGLRSSLYSHLRNYPTVTNHKTYVEVSESIGVLRHGLETRAFDEPLRIVFDESLVGQRIEFHCVLFGKQLKVPREETLNIRVTGPS